GGTPATQTPGAAPDSVAAPGPAMGPAVSGYDPVTGLVLGPDGLPLLFGGTGGQDRLAGPQSWKQLLLAGVSPGGSRRHEHVHGGGAHGIREAGPRPENETAAWRAAPRGASARRLG